VAPSTGRRRRLPSERGSGTRRSRSSVCARPACITFLPGPGVSRVPLRRRKPRGGGRGTYLDRVGPSAVTRYRESPASGGCEPSPPQPGFLPGPGFLHLHQELRRRNPRVDGRLVQTRSRPVASPLSAAVQRAYTPRPCRLRLPLRRRKPRADRSGPDPRMHGGYKPLTRARLECRELCLLVGAAVDAAARLQVN